MVSIPGRQFGSSYWLSHSTIPPIYLFPLAHLLAGKKQKAKEKDPHAWTSVIHFFFEFVFSPLLVASLHFELLYFASLLYASLHFCITTFYIIAFYCIYFKNINSFYYPASILSLFVYRIRECFSSIFFKFFCILLISIRDFTT